ncbi:MAG: hypothetical protein Q9218_003393 [Villophora microphyllina]
MSVEVSLKTPLAEALNTIIQPKLTEIGWATGQSDDLALGEYILLMLVNGRTQDQIAAELSNDLLQLPPDDTGADDFAKWLFEQVYTLNAQLNGSAAPPPQETQEGLSNATHPIGEHQSEDQDRQLSISGTLDADMSEAMEDVQDGSITGNRRLMGQLSKAMDRSGDAALHRVRPQQGTERINMHNRQPPKGPRIDQNRNQRGPPNLRAMSASNGSMPNGGVATPLMNASPQQQMAFLAMLEEQARMMSQMLSPQQQSLMPEGQKKAKLGDNVWTPNGDQEKEHVSERKFVDDKIMEELVVPEGNQAHSSEPSSLGAEIAKLGLEDQVLMTSKESVAAQNRFIYFPDHLVRLPGPGASLFQTAYTLLSEPLFKGLTWACMTEIARPARHNNDDESIGSFFSRRLNSGIADNVISAGIHGIYAGDIYQLSVRSIFPWFWHAERAMGSNMKAAVGKWSLRWAQDQDLEAKWANAVPKSDTIEAIKKSSVYTFRKGIGQLADQLAAKLKAFSNVNIREQTLVDEIELLQTTDTQPVQLVTRSKQDVTPGKDRETFDYVISTISGKALGGIVRPQSSLSMLAQTPSVTVMVVNLYFSNPSVLPARGFGYLLPRSLPFEQNPERALGVVFDSDATIGQDEIPGTKVTVMLGGHWWDGWIAYPDEEQGANMAKAILKRHLGISEEPKAVHVGLQKNCIPQYTVGHHGRMAQANKALKKFNGRLRVAGNSYNGVGLNDCVRSAEDVVTGLIKGSNLTGLEFFDEKNIPLSPYNQDH